MTEQANQESQKTVVAFIAGLLIGGLLVWVFSGDNKEMTSSEEVTAEATMGTEGESSTITTEKGSTSEIETGSEIEETPQLKTGKGDIDVSDQAAGTVVSIEGATFPSDEGWIGVRDYTGGQLSGLLGVARFSKEQSLVPESIILQRSTKTGSEYAVVFYSESGDRKFSLANDILVEGVWKTFTAK